MLFQTSWQAVGVFAFFVAGVLALSAFLGRKAKSASGYYAAHGQVHWFVNGVAFAGDYLSAASFLGICGMIAFFGYDGFLYSIGYLAGWIVALLVIAEPVKRLGRYTLADALDSRFNSRGIKFTVAIATLVISVFYLIPQMVGAGVLIKPLLGIPQWAGVLLVGVVVTTIVVTAGMVSTTWVQFIKGGVLVAFCAVLVVMILQRGFVASPEVGATIFGPDGKPVAIPRSAQRLTVLPDGRELVNGEPRSVENDLRPVGSVAALPGGVERSGPLGPLAFISTFSESTITTWSKSTVTEADGSRTTTFFPVERSGAELLVPGGSPTFQGIRSERLSDRLDFVSLMLALFCGTASLPHILIRYYTVKDGAAARRSTVVGIAAIGFFYVLTLYLGLGAMTSGALDPTDSNMAAPLLARSFSEWLFAVISAIAFTTVLGTVSGLIMAGSGAVAHDILENVVKVPMSDRQKVFAGKCAAAALGIGAMILGILFKQMNVTFLVGWAFNIAASANLPSLMMLLFWKGTTKQGIIASVSIGVLTSLGWILLSADTFEKVYGVDPGLSPVPFSQPGLVTIPLGFVVLWVVSKLTAGSAPRARA
jgi:cation/acetate symporter